MKKCLLFIMLGTVLPGGLIRQASAQDVPKQKPAESEYCINGCFGPAKPDYGFGLTGS